MNVEQIFDDATHGHADVIEAHRAGLAAVVAAVTVQTRRECAETAEWQYGWMADEEERATMIPRGPRLLIDEQFGTPESIAEFPRGQRIRRVKAGPWLPVNPEGAEK